MEQAQYKQLMASIEGLTEAQLDRAASGPAPAPGGQRCAAPDHGAHGRTRLLPTLPKQPQWSCTASSLARSACAAKTAARPTPPPPAPLFHRLRDKSKLLENAACMALWPVGAQDRCALGALGAKNLSLAAPVSGLPQPAKAQRLGWHGGGR